MRTLLLWPAAPVVFAAVVVSVPAWFLRRRNDRDWDTYSKNVNARAALGRITRGEQG